MGEYRVHVVLNRILAIHEKGISEGVLQANRYISNMSWRILRYREYDTKLCQIAIMATAAMGLDVSAVDVMYNEQDGYKVCEINCCPTISGNLMTQKYTDMLKYLFEQPREPFPYNNSMISKQLIFKGV